VPCNHPVHDPAHAHLLLIIVEVLVEEEENGKKEEQACQRQIVPETEYEIEEKENHEGGVDRHPVKRLDDIIITANHGKGILEEVKYRSHSLLKREIVK
jgi:hypothetical protein